MNRWKDPLMRLVEDHEKISEYVENMGEMVSLRYKEGGWDKLKQIDNFFSRNVVSHFAFEEDKVFPVLLSKVATPESKKLILDLQKEHKVILKELEMFRKSVSDEIAREDREAVKKLNATADRVMDMLQRHASKEDDEFLPLVSKNRALFENPQN